MRKYGTHMTTNVAEELQAFGLQNFPHFFIVLGFGVFIFSPSIPKKINISFPIVAEILTV